MSDLDKFQKELGISEEKLIKLYSHPDFNFLLRQLEESNPRFKDLPLDMKKVALSLFIQGDTDKIAGMWKFFYKRPIPTIQEFLKSEYIGSEASFYTEWSPWYKDICKVFSPESMVYEWCLTGSIGCIDTDTEFLTEFGWKKISEYKKSDKVGVYHPESDTVILESPLDYIKLPCNELTLIQSKGIDMCLSDEHRIVYWNQSYPGHKIIQLKEMKERHNKSKQGWSGRIKTNFKTNREGLDISEGELRLQVAVIADGHFSPEGKDNYCAMRFSKERKYKRIIELCEKFGLKYKDFGSKYCERYQNKTEYKVIVHPKFRDKSYTEKYWSCSSEQLEIIADEVGHWDGSFYKQQKGTSIHFFSVNKNDTDFIQYAFASSGYSTSCSLDNREGKKCYIARACYMKNGLRSIENKDRKLELKTYTPTDGKKYCFEVSTGMFVARRNGKIFITGNSAKSSVSRIAHFYNLYKITSLRYPQLAMGTGETKPMCLIFLTISRLKASESMTGMYTLLKQCKYFVEVKSEKDFAPFLQHEFCQYVPYYIHKVQTFERITFPNNVYVSLGTQLNHTIGSDLFGASLDEAEFKKGPDASKETYDLYTELLSRVTTRFIDTKYKLVTLVSSVKHNTGVISKHIEDLKYKKDYAYLSSYAIWEVKEQYRGAFEKYGHFYVLRGTMSHPSKVLDDHEFELMESNQYEVPESCKVIKVPKHPLLLAPFLANPDRALKEQAGEATSGGERPFDNLAELEDSNLAGEITLSASLTETKSLFNQLPSTLFQRTPDGLKLKRFPNALRYCFTGDTKVRVLSGVSKTMKELTEDHNKGIQNWVYSWSKEGWRPGRIESAHISNSVKELVQLTLDNGKTIKCTPDHQFMLRDGSYLEAKNLKESQSLMPCYSYITSEGYEKLVDNRKNKRTIHTHKISDHLLQVLPFSDRDKRYIRHHINENKLDNNPTNLVFMGDASHMKYHYGSSTSYKFRDKKEKARRGAKIMKDNWYGENNKEWRAKLKPTQAVSGKLKFTKYNEERFNGEKAKEYREWARNNLLAIKNNPKNQEKIKETNARLAKNLSIKYNSDPVVIKKRQIGKVVNFAKLLIEKGIELNEENWNSNRYAPMQRTWNTALKLIGSKEKLLELATFNHKIINVEFITLDKPEEVYDLTIDDGLDSHNFVLDAGIVTKNCHLDLADSGEAGISLCHKEVSKEGQIMYIFDFVAKVVTTTRISQTMIEQFMVDLKEIGNIKIKLLSADQYQSTYIRERLENQHKVAESVEKRAIGGETNIEPVLTSAILISEGAVKVGKCPELKEQLKGIFIYKDRLQYETTRKDMVDTFIGTLYGALNTSTDIPTNIYESYEIINKTLDLLSLDGIQEL